MASNLRSNLRKRRRASVPMQEFDELPPALRVWLHQAVLPWSPRSALRIWRRALSCHGRTDQAIGACKRAEEWTLAQERDRHIR